MGAAVITVTLTNEEARALAKLSRRYIFGDWHGVRQGKRDAFMAMRALQRIEDAVSPEATP